MPPDHAEKMSRGLEMFRTEIAPLLKEHCVKCHGGEKINLEVGQTYQMKIIKLSPSERKIGLSIRALKNDEFRTDWEDYQEGSGTGTATLGDHFRNSR